MRVIDKLKQNAISSRNGKKISLLEKIKENRLLKKISVIIEDFMMVGSNFGYDFQDKEKGFCTCLKALIDEAALGKDWDETVYISGAAGAAYFFAFLIIDNYPNSFNFKDVENDFPYLAYVGDTENLDISFNLVRTLYDIIKGNKDISKLDTIYNLCDVLHNGTVNEETIGKYFENDDSKK